MTTPPQFTSSYAVLPSFIMDDETLEEGAKILYARISMYSQEGRCWASNQHFADKQKVTIRCIQNWLAQLKAAEYIEIELETGGFQTKRNIWIINDFKRSYTKRNTVHPPLQPNAPPPAPQFTHISNKEITIKEQQQQSAAALPKQEKKELKDPINVNLLYIEIPDSEKRWISEHYEDADIRHAVAWATHPETKIKSTLEQAIKWACVNKPAIPTNKEDNKSIAEELKKKALIPKHLHGQLNMHIASSYVEIVCGPKVEVLQYSEKGFREILMDLLRKSGCAFA